MPLTPPASAIEIPRPRFVDDVDAVLFRAHIERVDETRAAGRDNHGRAAPELESAVDPERLPPEIRHEAYALIAHPEHRLLAALDQDFAEIRVGAVLRDPRHVVEEIGLGVAAEIADTHLLVGEVGRKRADVVSAFIDHPHQTIGIDGITAALLDRRALEQQDAASLFPRGERRTQCCIAPAHDDDVVVLVRQFGHVFANLRMRLMPCATLVCEIVGIHAQNKALSC